MQKILSKFRLKYSLLPILLGISPLLGLSLMSNAFAETLVLAATPKAKPAAVSPTDQTPKPVELGADGLSEGSVFVQADEITTTEDNVIIAKGHVEMRYDGRLVRADQVHYDQASGLTVAQGHAMIINADGTVQFADSLEVVDKARTGSSSSVTAATGRRVASYNPDGTRIFANEINHVNDKLSILNKVLYTPCQLCVKNEKTQAPAWSIQAGQIIQDKTKNVVIYHNAIIQIKGLPVFYLPVLWHADPSVKRASGLLMPKLDISDKRGVTYSQPYYWAISPYQSLIIEPRFNSKINPFLNLSWERAFYSGTANIRLGYGHDTYFDSRGQKWTSYIDTTDPSQIRRLPLGDAKAYDLGYILASGDFKLNDKWRWNFTAEHIFDHDGANLFERYKVEKAFKQRGDFIAASRQLINQISVIRQTPISYFGLSSMSFQSQRFGGAQVLDLTDKINRPVASSSKLLPNIAPLVELHIAPSTKVFGGRLQFDLSGVNIMRTAYAQGIEPVYINGTDSQRVTAQLGWRRDFTTNQGLRIAPYMSLRQDAYHLKDLNASHLSANVNRSSSTIGVDINYPLYQRFKGYSVELIPRALLAISPKTKANSLITNEDSQIFEFDSSTLFKANKSPGFDLYEGGNRISLGIDAIIKNNNGLRVQALIGRTFRDSIEDIYLQRVAGAPLLTYDPSGLAKKQSDWLVDANFSTRGGFYGYSRLRLDANDGFVRHGEFGLSANQPNSLLTLRYVVDRTNPKVVGGLITGLRQPRYESTTIYGRHFFTKQFGVSARLNLDNRTHQWHQSELSLIYRDDCTWLELVYLHDDSVLNLNSNLKPTDSLSIRVNLITFSQNETEFSDIR